MPGVIQKLGVVTLLLGVSAGGFAQEAPKGPPKAGVSRKRTKAPKPSAAQRQTPVQPEVQAPPQPVAPPRPDQMPPTAPQVTYQNGQLSIVAQNSTLSSILAAVRARTGAQVEMPADTANDRVAVKLGPGNPRDVLASLLEGSRFDYIVLGSATDPIEVSQVILTPRQGVGATSAVAGASTPAGMMSGGQPPRPGGFRGVAGPPEMNAEEDEPVVEAQPQSVPPPQPEPPGPGAVMPLSPPPHMQGAPGPDQPQPGATGQQNPNQVKTPEQLLLELQRMQQLQQQQQQQQQRREPQQ